VRYVRADGIRSLRVTKRMAEKRTYDFADEGFLARLEHLHLIAKCLAARGHAGARRSRRLGDGLEFADHRDYFRGDDIRFIDWPYYARMEKLLLRLFHEHSEADVVILLDTSASMAPGGAMEKFNYARRAAAALAYVAMGSLERVILQPFAETLGEQMRSGRSRLHALEVLDFLARLAPSGRTMLGQCAARFAARQETSAVGTAVIISDLMDCADQLSEALARLVRRTRGGLRQAQSALSLSKGVTVVHVYSPADESPCLAGPVLLHEAETGRRMTLNVTDDLVASYRRRFAEFGRACEHACLSRGAAYARAPTSVPFEHLVLHTLKRAGVLA
jgi:uncharacterized protein (DUF58 family)